MQKTKADLWWTLGDLWGIGEADNVMVDRMTYCENIFATKELTIKKGDQASKEIKFIKKT